MKYILYLYVYRLHNTFYLEIFDRIPSLALSPLQARAIHLKHYNRVEYRTQQFASMTDVDSATDTEGVFSTSWMTDSSMSRSSSSANLSQIGSLSVYTSDPMMYASSASNAGSVTSTGGMMGRFDQGRNGKQPVHDHHFFAMQIQTEEKTGYERHSPEGLQSPHSSVLSYENAYANPFNVQMVVDLPSVSCSLYNVVSGCYKEVLHVYLNGIRCVIQRGGCELFSRLFL